MNRGIPSGVLALSGDAVRRQREAESRCLAILEREGFEPVLLPVLEFVAGHGEGDGYRFVDGSGRLIALRTDFTPLAARVFAPTLAAAALPLQVCYAGEVVRPRPARLRQLPELYQLGFESYGVAGGGARALELTLSLLEAVGISQRSCRLVVGIAGLGEEILAQLLEEPADAELIELLRVHDFNALADVLGLRGGRRAALADALLGAPPERWAEALGVVDEVDRAAPLLDLAERAGVAVAFEVAPRLAGDYYHGVVFSLWGPRTRAVLAAGGEYQVRLVEATAPAAGACLAVGVAIEEAGC